MTRAGFPDDGFHVERQHNSGPGTFVGRDLHIQTLDPKTKALVAKLARDAPELGALLKKALEDGVIDPDMAFALDRAARSINADVAEMLMMASRRINEDVASTISHAANGINEDVAMKLSLTSAEFSRTVSGLEEVLGRIRSASTTLSSTNSNLAKWEGVAESIGEAAQNAAYAAQIDRQSEREWSWHSFQWGMGACLALIIGLLTLWTFAIK